MIRRRCWGMGCSSRTSWSARCGTWCGTVCRRIWIDRAGRLLGAVPYVRFELVAVGTRSEGSGARAEQDPRRRPVTPHGISRGRAVVRLREHKTGRGVIATPDHPHRADLYAPDARLHVVTESRCAWT